MNDMKHNSILAVIAVILGMLCYLERQHTPAPSSTAKESILGFPVLASYPYEVGGDGKPTPKSAIPKPIKDYDGKSVTVTGFMVPLGMTEQGVTQFVLVKNQMLCCYGQTPKMNEWIFVTMASPIAPLTDLPIEVHGTLHVGEEYQQNQLVSLYRLDGQSLEKSQ